MQFSKKMLIVHIFLTVCLCIATVACALWGVDATPVGVLAGVSFVTDGTWGGFYLWKSKNENRAKYAQKFINMFAKKYGVDAAIRVAEIVLKD